ncbi:hypothetical protein ACNTMW_32425 [Planosporangium sp. 12N6]|uniref:hypothetical protein n=1 Tax=Planosporangium spinosum TaxID=3402278 RepID=UPI003CEB4985
MATARGVLRQPAQEPVVQVPGGYAAQVGAGLDQGGAQDQGQADRGVGVLAQELAAPW